MTAMMKPQLKPSSFISQNSLATVFALYSIVFIAIVALQMPPYQNPDETNHFFRAEQISRLGFMPEQLSNGLGGTFVDIGIVETAVPFLTVALHPERKVTSSLYESATSVGWGRQLTQVAFPNTAIYPPTFYLPAVAGIWIGKITGSSVVRTLYFSRMANGICATVIATLAIALAEGAALWLFAVLTLPITMALFSAVSQDGMMIACTALATSIVAKARHTQVPVSDRRFAALFLALMAICMSRPPYSPLAGLVLIIPWRSLRVRAASLVLIAAAVVAWSMIALHTAGLDVAASQSDPKRQLYGLLGRPSQVFALLGNTYRTYGPDYLEQIVGRLGNLDVALPAFVHLVAWATLTLAAILSISQAIRQKSLSVNAVLATILFMAACIMLINMTQYLTFTSVSRATIEGVQGRYFLEVIMVLPVFIYGYKPLRTYQKIVTGAVVLMAMTYIPMVVNAVLHRYYV